MSEIFNIYCDESCHLEKDNEPIMLFGAVWCDKFKAKEINNRIKEIKTKHKISPFRELKWTKISNALIDCYKDLVNYFFDNHDLNFRCFIVKNKKAINYTMYGHTHDELYYKLYFDMLKNILEKDNKYNIFIDTKDTNSKERIRKLKEVLSNSQYDFSMNMIPILQTIKSHEVQIMQLTDIFTGALAYFNRGLTKVKAKNEIIEIIKNRTKNDLNKNSLYRETKFNVFYCLLQEEKNELF